MSLTIACSCLLCFILSAGFPRCMLCCRLFIRQRKWKKSLSSCRSRIGDKGQQGNNHGPLLCFVPLFFCIRPMSLLSSYPFLYRASKHTMACSTKKYFALTRHFYQHIKATQLSPFHWCKNRHSNMVCMKHACCVFPGYECHPYPPEMGHREVKGEEKEREALEYNTPGLKLSVVLRNI